MTASAARLDLVAAPPPPIRRDRVVQVWAGTATVSWAGDAILTVAIAWTAVNRLSPGWAGAVVAVATLPQALLMIPGGILADRVDTRRLLIIGELARIVVLLAAITLWLTGHQTGLVLAAVGACFGAVAGLTFPARATLLRQLVIGQDLAVAVGWVQLGGNLAALAGAPLGGVVVTTWGLTGAMAIDAATFAVVLLVLVTVVRPRFRLPRPAQQSWHVAVTSCVGYLRADRSARALVVALFAPNIFLGPAETLGLPLRIATSGWPATWLGAAQMTSAIGATVGCLTALRWRTAHPTVRAFQLLVLQGVAIIAVGVDSAAFVFIGMLIIGFTSGAASVWLSAVFQRTIAPDYLGRVASVGQLGDLVLLPAMTPGFGLLASAASLLTAATAFGASMAACSGWFATRPQLRHLPPPG